MNYYKIDLIIILLKKINKNEWSYLHPTRWKRFKY